MNRPLVSVVLAYAAGILLGLRFPLPLVPLFATAGFILSLGLILARLRPLLLWPLLLIAGWTNYTVNTAVISPHDLRTTLGDQPAIVTVRGQMVTSPRLAVLDRDGQKIWHSLTPVQVHEIRPRPNSSVPPANFQPADGQILVTTPSILPTNYFAGQTVEISGLIARPQRPVAPGLFDYQDYLATHGIYYQLKVEAPADWSLRSPPDTPLPVSDRFLAWSQTTLALGLPEQDEPLELLWAMTLGWMPALTQEVSAPFMQTGTMHIFAISGLHIALIAGILMSVLRALQLPRFWCGLVIIPLIWFYTAATGWQPSAIRSTIMMSVVIGGWMLKRPGDLLNSLAGAAFILLLWDPQQLLQTSFQLSFFVVLSIALLLPPLEKIRDRCLATDPLLPPELLPRWQRWRTAVLRVLLTALTVSIAAWAGSWPLTAFYFHMFSPVTLLANLVIVPLSSFALASNLGGIVCGAWFTGATELFNHGAWLWMKLMLLISHQLIQWPGAFFNVCGPTAVDFGIYYTALFAASSGLAFRKRWRLATAIFLTGSAACYGWCWHDAWQTTTLSFLPLRGGSAVFSQGGGAGNTLIDCGDTNALHFITEPFLKARGVNRLSQFILTQGDTRDNGGANRLLELFPARQVITSEVKFRSPSYRQTLAALERFPTDHRTVVPGDMAGNWQVLYPTPTNHFPQADDNSLVLRGEFHGTKILFLADLGRLGQRDLLAQQTDLHADIVATGLPDKNEPLIESLLDAIQPKVILVLDSEQPATKRATAALHERLSHRQLPVFYTRSAGAITLVTKPGGWELRTMDGQRLTSAASPTPPTQIASRE